MLYLSGINYLEYAYFVVQKVKLAIKILTEIITINMAGVILLILTLLWWWVSQMKNMIQWNICNKNLYMIIKFTKYSWQKNKRKINTGIVQGDWRIVKVLFNQLCLMLHGPLLGINWQLICV